MRLRSYSNFLFIFYFDGGMMSKELEANAQADKKMIDFLWKKIMLLENENRKLAEEVSKQKKYIEALEKQNRQIVYSPTKRQLDAMQRIIKTHTEV
jgi:FtsZ-binding cell division protein ZapB